MLKLMFGLLILAFFSFSGKPAKGEETRLIVRVKSKDAKFIGSSMGGVLVLIKDADSGEILAKGFVEGSTGDTERIMETPPERGHRFSDEFTAKFETSLELVEPKLVTIEAQGPYAQRQAMVKSSTQIWLIPGKHIVGDGVVLEISGFALDIMTPQAHEKIKLNDRELAVPITANMVMM